MIASSFLYLPLLIALAQAVSVPKCSQPPPPNFLPSARDCLRVASVIARIADGQRDVQQLWSRAPVASGHGWQLPYVFALPDGDCEVLIDTVYDNAADAFPTREISTAAVDLVAVCLFGITRRESAVGHVKVGPKDRILVYIRKHFEPRMITGKNNTALAFNGTELAVMEVGLDGGANLTSTG